MHIIRNNSPHHKLSELRIGQYCVIADPTCMYNGHTFIRALDRFVSLTDPHIMYEIQLEHDYAVKLLSVGTTLTIDIGV